MARPRRQEPFQAPSAVGGRIASAQQQPFGFLAARYESGGRGVRTISSGRGDPGGRSYGVFQLSSQAGMPAFLRSPEGEPYRARFGNYTPGSGPFNAAYSLAARTDPEGFAAAQQAYLTRTHYEPVRRAAETAGFDTNNRGVQEALFSMSLQHGRARDIVTRAGGQMQPGTPAGDQVGLLYNARSRYVSGLPNLSAETRQSVLSRYQSERRDALRVAAQPVEPAPLASTAPAPQAQPTIPPDAQAGLNPATPEPVEVAPADVGPLGPVTADRAPAIARAGGLDVPEGIAVSPHQQPVPDAPPSADPIVSQAMPDPVVGDLGKGPNVKGDVPILSQIFDGFGEGPKGGRRGGGGGFTNLVQIPQFEDPGKQLAAMDAQPGDQPVNIRAIPRPPPPTPQGLPVADFFGLQRRRQRQTG